MIITTKELMNVGKILLLISMTIIIMNLQQIHQLLEVCLKNATEVV